MLKNFIGLACPIAF